MWKTLLKAIGKSIGIICLLSGMFGLGTYFIAGSFWGGFCISACIQIVGGYLWNTILERRDRMYAETLINQATETPVPTELSCAYCNVKNRVPLLLSENNVFKCVSCNQPNNVYIQYTTVRVTQPLAKNEAVGDVDMGTDEPRQRQTTINEPIQVTGEKKEA